MKYFTVAEFVRSDTADKRGIDNRCKKEHVVNITTLVNKVLDPLREAYGKPIRITSGYRCPELNKAVKGSATSDHVNGCAADIVGTPATREENRKLFYLIQSLGLPFTQLIDEKNFSWVHVSYDSSNLKKQVLKFIDMGNIVQKLEIPNHAGYYADTDGNIYNKKGHRLIPQRQGEYLGVDLPIGNGKYKKFAIHRLIAITFIKNDGDKPQVNHKDGNKHNNTVANLEWNTESENQKHRFRELHHSHFGEKNTQAKLSKQNVIDIVKLRTNGIDLGSISSMFKVTKSTICDIMSGRSWSHITGLPPKRNISRMEALGYAI